MRYREADIEALKAVDVMHAYCSAVLGQGKLFGRVWKYPCPFGSHTRLKLEVAERGGAGVAICRACNRGGSVFDIAAAVLGVDARRDFLRCVEEVAEKTGVRMADAGSLPPSCRRSAHALPTPCRRPVADSGAQVEYLPAEDERSALEAVARAAGNEAAMRRHAAALGLPFEAVMFHTRAEEAAPLGLLGLTRDERLLYVYTARDAAGSLRVTMTKRRGMAGDKPRFLAHGRKCGLWGADAIADARRVIITEGESDCLALRASVWAWADAWAQDEPETFPPQASFPVVLAKPDAGTFRPSWAAALRGRDVILAADADTAGKDGAQRTANILREAGVRRVFLWTPEPPCKDARAALDVSRPWRLAESLFIDKKPLYE